MVASKRESTRIIFFNFKSISQLFCVARFVAEINNSVMVALDTDTLLCDDVLQEFSETAVNTFLLVILILSVLGNSAVCIIVSRHYQLHTVTNAYFVNTAVVQFLFALFSIPPYLRAVSLSNGSLLSNQWICVFIGFFFEWFAALSNLALTLMTIERYYVVKHSGSKKISAKTTGMVVFIASLWALVFAVVWAVLEEKSAKDQCSTALNVSYALVCFPLLSYRGKETLRIFNITYVIICLLLPTTLMVSLFLKMSRTLRTGTHSIRPLGVGNQRTIRFFAELKTARTIFFISILHLCCWLPICVVSLYISLHRQPEPAGLKITKVKALIVCLAFASSCVNPLIYALRNPRLSIIFRQIKRRRKKRVHFNSNQEKLGGKIVKATNIFKSEETLTTTTSSC